MSSWQDRGCTHLAFPLRRSMFSARRSRLSPRSTATGGVVTSRCQADSDMLRCPVFEPQTRCRDSIARARRAQTNSLAQHARRSFRCDELVAHQARSPEDIPRVGHVDPCLPIWRGSIADRQPSPFVTWSALGAAICLAVVAFRQTRWRRWLAGIASTTCLFVATA